ncbi:MAG: hypothetical protein KUG83_05425 [Gammaproteobacteria bacterium]|nr:hypothetical protein [Gammaproteobacteria bacterium]
MGFFDTGGSIEGRTPVGALDRQGSPVRPVSLLNNEIHLWAMAFKQRSDKTRRGLMGTYRLTASFDMRDRLFMHKEIAK